MGAKRMDYFRAVCDHDGCSTYINVASVPHELRQTLERCKWVMAGDRDTYCPEHAVGVSHTNQQEQ